VSGTAAVALVTVLFITLPNGGLGAPAGPGHQPTASPSATSTQADADPLTSDLAFSSLPSGFDFAGVNVAPGSDTRSISAANPATGQLADVEIQPSTQTPTAPGGGGPQSTAPPVRSASAFWLWAPGSTIAGQQNMVILIWKITPDQWAYLSFTSTDTSTAITGTVHQLAESVRIGADTQYPLPLAFTPPPNMSLISASSSFFPPHGWLTGLRYANGDDDNLIINTQQPNTNTAARNGVLGASDATISASTTINGCAVTVVTLASISGETLVAPDCDGLDIQISATAMSIDDILGFFGSITWFGPDPANWITDVIG
jgi:hypothetical protein